MSSKGDHETTNDGSDSKHREKIAAHYKGWLFFINGDNNRLFRVCKDQNWSKMVPFVYSYC